MTVQGGKLSGVDTIDTKALILDDVAIDEAVSIAAWQVTIGAGQSVSGDSFALSGRMVVAAGQTLDNIHIDVMSNQASLEWTGSPGQTTALGAGVMVTVGAGDVFGLSSFSDPMLTNAGSFAVAGIMDVNPVEFDNTGTILVSAGGTLAIQANERGSKLVNAGVIALTRGVLELDPASLTNTGALSVTDGTLALGGMVSLASLHVLPSSGSALEIIGTLSLGGKTVTPGQGGTPNFGLEGVDTLALTIQDGTLAIVQGQNFSVMSGNNYYDNKTIAGSLINNGIISLSNSAPSSAPNLFTISGAVSGTGTIALVAGAHADDDLRLTSSVGAGQTIAFVSGIGTLILGASAIPSFAGILDGFSIGDKIMLDRQDGTKASFSGDSIVVTLKTGSTITLATSSPLPGSLTTTRNDEDGNITLTDVSTTPNIHDWSATDIGAAPAMRGGVEQAYAAPILAHENVTAWALMHHGF